jgi:DNA-binding NarL/FixJ family response regulator
MRAGWRPDIAASSNGKDGLIGHADTMPVSCLIVDDSRDFLDAARELLERDGIAVVGGVSTGAQACRLCREQRPDVALIDIDLGEETGFQVARQLADQAGPRPCMILTSAYSDDDFADMIADNPAVSFLPKAWLSGAAIRGILAGAGR